MLLLCLSTLIQGIYLATFKPQQAKYMSRLELTTEFLVLICTYFMVLYTDGFILM